jgi:hypothetical protein
MPPFDFRLSLQYFHKMPTYVISTLTWITSLDHRIEVEVVEVNRLTLFFFCPCLSILCGTHNRPPCNRHYLLYHGCQSSNCPYSHSYMLTSSELARLRTDSLKSPCTSFKTGYKCLIGEENCHMGHRCPYGRECKYGLMCKFLSIREFLFLF